MPKVPPPSPPYRGPAAHHGGSQGDPVRIVIHGTVSATRRGAADATALYFRTTDRDASCHYVCDPWATRQVVWDHTVAYHAPPNTGSVGIELTDTVAGNRSRWWDIPHRLMVRRGARLTGRLAAAYEIPLVKVNGAALRSNGGRGVCGHSDVRDAWHQTDHWDPGPGFPWGRFMRIAKRRAAVLRARHGVAARLTRR